MIFEREEIDAHEGIFGIEAAEWIASTEYAEMVKAAENAAVTNEVEVIDEPLDNSEIARESALLLGYDSLYGVYQLKQGEGLRDYRFESFAGLRNRGFAVERKNYELVYTAPLLARDTLSNLNRVYETLNRNRPEDFTGHSLSVSDVVVLQWRGNISSHYVDSTGFKELSGFTGHEKLADIQKSHPLQVRQDGKSLPPPRMITVAEKGKPPMKPIRPQGKPRSSPAQKQGKPRTNPNQNINKPPVKPQAAARSNKPPIKPQVTVRSNKPSILQQVRESVAAIAKAKNEPPPTSNREEHKEV